MLTPPTFRPPDKASRDIKLSMPKYKLNIQVR